MQAKLIRSAELAPGVRHFTFQSLGPGPFHFEAGQFVSFSEEIGGKVITRAYSIASPPDGTNCFELCLNLVPEGFFSSRLFEMEPGETVEMREPLGMFMLRQPPRDSVFIATGTGIAPFRSMLKRHLHKSSPAFTLLFGVRYESHLMYRREFEELAEFYPQFHFRPTLSRPEPGWSGRTGHVQAHLEEALGGRRDLDIYLCGLKLMVDDVRAILKGMGFDRKQIFYEKYD
ncbi:MAG TPA: FAD-binding oxidoreductase [Bryobacteraceae bacterium]|nr:FAD-binding oxidoreductase [Bryobacteraceae bacterium]